MAPATSTQDRRRVVERLAERLKAGIVGGRWPPGAPLPSERELAQRHDVNRSSVREALRRLEAWGLVEIRHGESTRVRDFLVTAGAHLLPQLFDVGQRLDPSLAADLHDIRGMLLGWCAERAAQVADPASVARLDALAKRLADARAKPKELQELDYDFFQQLVAITGNRLLAVFANLVRDVYMQGRGRFLALYEKGVFEPAHHQRAVAAIRRRDAAGAAQAMRAHAASALRTVEAE